MQCQRPLYKDLELIGANSGDAQQRQHLHSAVHPGRNEAPPPGARKPRHAKDVCILVTLVCVNKKTNT